MSSTATVYTILSRSQVNQWDDQLQRAETGWKIAVRWEATSTVFSVFVADRNYTPDQVDAAIRAAGAKDEQIETLGG